MALVGDRRPGVAVADDRSPRRQRGFDHLGDVLGTVRGHEQSFGSLGDLEVGGVEHEPTHLRPERRVTRFEGEERRCPEAPGETPGLGRLPAPFAALEGDEMSRHSSASDGGSGATASSGPPGGSPCA